jgi:hypothetical protein
VTAPPTVVVSVDIETTGPSPAVGSMLSVGAVAYDEDGAELGDYYATLLEVGHGGLVGSPPAPRDADTMRWWSQWPDRWEDATRSPRYPTVVMREFAAWVEALPGRPVFLAWPAGFDWSFVSYYLWRYVGRNPFGYSPLCLKAFGAGLVDAPEAMLSSREEGYFPADWVVTPARPHHALDDARAQGEMWRRMAAAARGRTPLRSVG